MGTAKTTLSSTGCIRRKVKGDTGSHGKQIERGNTEKKAAHGKKKKDIRKTRATHSLTRKEKRGIKKGDIRKSFILMRGTEAAWIKERDRGKKSTGEGSPR